MRILHLDSGKEMRGGQWQVLRLMEGLAAAGVEQTLLARRGSPLFVAAAERGWPVGSLRLIDVAIRARRHDLVHAHDAHSHTLAVLAGAAPLIVARRVAFPVKSRWKYGRAQCYVAVSEYVRSVLLQSGVPQEKIVVVPDGVPLLNRAQGTALLAVANASDPLKGEGLARDAARLAGLKLDVTSDLERDLPRAALFLYVTHHEGLGSAALLAMAAGVPVVASDVGGLREIIRSGENGVLVQNFPEAIAVALKNLTANPQQVRTMGLNARRTIEERFTTAHMVRRTMEVYRQVLS